MANKKIVIVTGASQGIGAAVVQAFLDRGYNVVATSRSVSKAGFEPSPNLALVDGDIGQAATAEKVTQTAISQLARSTMSSIMLASSQPSPSRTIPPTSFAPLCPRISKDSYTSPNAPSSRCWRRAPAAA